MPHTLVRGSWGLAELGGYGKKPAMPAAILQGVGSGKKPEISCVRPRHPKPDLRISHLVSQSIFLFVPSAL